jgi:membrane protease YdiL (CAAX protease family)
MNDTLDGSDGRTDRWSTFFQSRLDTSRIREASWTVLLGTVVVAAAMTAAFQANRAAVLDLLRPFVEATGGLVEPTLLIYLPFLVLIVGGLVLRIGSLRPRDVGLVRSHLGLGAGITVATWLLMQATGAVTIVVQGRPLGLHDYWTTAGVLAILGGFLGQILGNALFEEVIYRAFLMPQLVTKFERHLSDRASPWVFVLALVVSQGVFALIHVPGRLADGVAVGSLLGFLAAPFLFGVLFVLVYYRTGNLFVAIGLHALVNDPVFLVNAGAVVLIPLLAVILGILVGWPYVARRVGHPDRRFTSV